VTVVSKAASTSKIFIVFSSRYLPGFRFSFPGACKYTPTASLLATDPARSFKPDLCTAAGMLPELN